MGVERFALPHHGDARRDARSTRGLGSRIEGATARCLRGSDEFGSEGGSVSLLAFDEPFHVGHGVHLDRLAGDATHLAEVRHGPGADRHLEA